MNKRALEEPLREEFSPPKKTREEEKEEGGLQSQVGKRIHRNQKVFNAGVGAPFPDDVGGVGVFSQENLTSLMHEPKPQRFVVKRYWTEDEVIIAFNLFRMRN